MTGYSPRGLDLLPDEERVIVSGILVRSHVVSLADFNDTSHRLDADELMALAEIQSGLRMVGQGAGMTNLSSRAWLERWQAFRARHSEMLQPPWDEESIQAWHAKRDQELLHDAPFSAGWHRSRLRPDQ